MCSGTAFDDLGIPVQLAYFKPGSGMNKSATILYEKNILQITRQVKYSLQMRTP